LGWSIEALRETYLTGTKGVLEKVLLKGTLNQSGKGGVLSEKKKRKGDLFEVHSLLKGKIQIRKGPGGGREQY